MSLSFRIVRPALALAVLCASPAAAAGQSDPGAGDRGDSATHLLNRIAYGPRPGDVDRVLAMGIVRYIELQLHPERLADSAADARLARLEVFQRSTADLARAYHRDVAAFRARQRGADSARPAGHTDGRRPTASRRYVAELQQAVVIRAVLSERHLYEIVVDFWTNHFNVFLGKGANRFLMKEYVEETVRPRALGRFEDLLIATARSPAMLVYLDNAQSVAEGAEPPQLARLRRRGPAADSLRARLEARLPRGLNENYARELLELHTVGVDGGYTQDDVVAVARVLTGWSVQRRAGTPVFTFHGWAHDRGEKVVMGRVFRAGGGMEEGDELLRWLADHPATRRHVSAKLCARFVADEPPADCIVAAVEAWQRHGGDIREIVRAILHAPAFWAPEHRGTKFKTPLEFVASAVRAVGGAPDTTLRLAQVVQRLGQPLYLEPAPTGYSDAAADWANPAALMERLNVALALAAGRLPGVTMPHTPPDPRRLGLVLGGPAFQRQ